MRTITSSINLDAPADQVWDALVTPTPQRGWDPFIIGFDTPDGAPPAVGDRLRIRIAPPGRRPMGFRPRVVAAERGRSLEWIGHLGMRGVFDGHHRFHLEPLPDGGTRLTHAESFRGLLVPVLWRSLEEPTRAGFESCNAALAAHVIDADIVG